MKITQIRNATQIIQYAGKTFLIDPLLAPKGSYPGFAGTARAEIRNPTVEQIYVQNEQDAESLHKQGFTHLTVLADETKFGDITLHKTTGQHGSDRTYADPAMAKRLGAACGVVFQHPTEKTLYLAGDTLWRDDVEATMLTFQPEVVVLNAGFAHVLGHGAIIMGAEDILKTHFTLPEAQIVATHMEAVNHCLLTRDALKEYARDNQIIEFVNVPEDGETLTF
ncbi:MBL fold metallo-hydrolase [Escherichia coli]|nr:MBL fold metallo-hydrolase [Escherichia coli]EIB8313973.1 MBL fold metallo-hydrolase [Escherichia coli]ELW1471962.1 MBL fold metallo-hydrolase [Escherichia coli]ELY7480538.1 MBL fold metallo-hydrolase [Escherichia coli]